MIVIVYLDMSKRCQYQLLNKLIFLFNHFTIHLNNQQLVCFIPFSGSSPVSRVHMGEVRDQLVSHASHCNQDWDAKCMCNVYLIDYIFIDMCNLNMHNKHTKKEN